MRKVGEIILYHRYPLFSTDLHPTFTNKKSYNLIGRVPKPNDKYFWAYELMKFFHLDE
jgi:hypothetical protein